MYDLKKYLLSTLACLLILGLFAFNPSDDLPLDESVIIGTLPNGLTYYIKQNSEPIDMAFFQLALKVGSILEDDDQQGIAHFVEHAAFSGTENFPEYSIREYMDSIGFGFMGGLNAATSNLFTIYMLQSRANDSEQLNNAILFMSEWAARVSFDEEMIEKERGIILEEIRGRRGFGDRMMRDYWNVLFEGSKFPERLPSGLPEIIETVPRQRIIDFYQDWYRPDLMAVIAIGDFEDIDEIRDMIHNHFNTIPRTENPRPIPYFEVPEHTETKFVLRTDPEAEFTGVMVGHKLHHEPVITIADYRYRLIDTLLGTLLDNRFAEISRQQDPPFVQGGAYKITNFNTIDMFSYSALLDDQKLLEGITSIFTEIERAKQHGFHSSELRRAKNSMLNSIEQRYTERDNVLSMRLAFNYIFHFLENNPMMSIEDEFEIVRFLLDTIDVDDIADALEENTSDENRVVTLTVPETYGVELPSEETILALLDEISEIELEPFPETTITEPLLRNIPRPARVSKPKQERFTIGSGENAFELEMFTWSLRNGATVRLVPTDFRNNEILLNGFRTGGLSQVEDDIYDFARVAAEIMEESGMGAFDKNLLEIYLDDKIVSFNTRITDRAENISGRSSIADFETLMQMVYLNFTSPRFDEAGFETWKLRKEITTRNQQNSPDFAFDEAVENLLYNNHFREKFLSVEDIQQTDHQIAFDFHKNRFNTARDFNFNFIGNINKDELQEYIRKYIATLPNRRIDTRIIDRNIRFNQTPSTERVYRGQDDRTLVRLVFTSDLDYSLQEQYNIMSTTLVLNQLLLDTVREQLSGVYFIYAFPEIDVQPYPQIAIHIHFGCDPHRIDEIIEEINVQINHLFENTFEDKHITMLQETFRQSIETQMRRNDFVLSALTSSLQYGYDLNETANPLEKIDAITKEVVSNTAQKYFAHDRRLMIILYPEGFDDN